MVTDAEDVSENSEAFVCSVQETSGKGTLNSSACNSKLLFFIGFVQYRSWKTLKVMEFVFPGLESHRGKLICIRFAVN